MIVDDIIYKIETLICPITVVRVYQRDRSELMFFTGGDDDEYGQVKAELLAKLNVPENQIWFGDSSHREKYEAVRRALNDRGRTS